jgi:uncharacterized protein YjdB
MAVPFTALPVFAVDDGTIAVTGVEISGIQTVEVDGTITLTATIEPENATDQTLSWTSDDSTIASVVGGVVTGVAVGATNITVTTTDGSFTDSLTIAVTEVGGGVVDDGSDNETATHEITINTQPESQTTVTEGEISGSLSVSASVDPADSDIELAYMWHISADNEVNLEEDPPVYPDETGSSMTIPTELEPNEYYYFCVVFVNDGGASGIVEAISDIATVTVEAPPPVITINTHPQSSITVTEGSSGTLTVEASVEPTAILGYTWFESEDNTTSTLDDDDPLFEELASSMDIPTDLTQGIHYFYCVVYVDTDQSICEFSNIATVTVQAAPRVTAVVVSPTTVEVQAGDTYNFSAGVFGTNLTNHFVNWDVGGETSSGTYMSGSELRIGEDESNTTLTVTATSQFDPTKSGTATVTVTQGYTPGNPTYSLIVDGTSFGPYAEGTQVSISATVPDGMVFVTWLRAGGYVNDIANNPTATMTFNMPAGSLILTTVCEEQTNIDTPVEPEEPPAPPEPTPEPTPEPSTPSAPENYSPPPAPPAPPAQETPVNEGNSNNLPVEVERTENGAEFTAPNGVISKVEETPDGGVKVEAGINESGAVNAQATAAAVAEAAAIAQANGESSFVLQIPEGAQGLSKNTIQQIVEAAGDMEITLELTAIVDGEVVGGVTVPLSSSTGQILTGLAFETKRTAQAEEYVAEEFGAEVLGAFETAQKGGWGDEPATLTVGLDKLGFNAEDGTKLQALIFDTKSKKWYTAEAEIIDGNVVIITKRSGLITIVAAE